jgi:hypothetical protein
MNNREARQLDAEIARRVLGWENVSSAYLWGKDDGWGGNNPLTPDRGIQDLPHYSTDIASAMEVVEKVIALGFDVEIHGGPNGGWAVIFKDDNPLHRVSAAGPSLPDDICRAALSASAAKG